jgi:hypothetical protein
MIENKRFKEGDFIGMGIAIGIPIGVPIGLILDSLPLGLAVSLPFGLAVGGFLEKNYNQNPIRLTETEKNRRKKWSLILIGVGLIILAGLAMAYLVQE